MASSAQTAKPLRADARRNRERVLDAASECFATDGTNAQMDDIAAMAGVGIGTVYRHFATKGALVDALADLYFEGEAALARAQLDVEDPWDAFSGMIRNGAELLASSRGLSQLTADRPEIMQRAAIAADEKFGFFGMIETLISRAQEAGALRHDFELEDVPSIMCSLGALQISRGAYANWRRVLEIVIDGLHPADEPSELPPLVARLPRSGPVC